MSKESRWMQTYTAKKFYPFLWNPDNINIIDIAESLSKICRFNGHCDGFYSVAEHSIHVSNLVDKKYAFDGLMHDATESLGINDICREIKLELPEYKKLENKLYKQIAEKFNLKPEIPKAIKNADLLLLKIEKRELMNKFKNLLWKGIEDIKLKYNEHRNLIQRWDYNTAKVKFLERFYELSTENESNLF